MIFIKLASILALVSTSSHVASVKALAAHDDEGAPKLLRGGLDSIAITSDAEQGVDKLHDSGGISIAVETALGTTHCGCDACTQTIWDTPATDGGGDWTCGERINHVKTHDGWSEIDACSKVASEFSHGPCGPCECKSDPSPVPVPVPVPVPTTGGNEEQKCGGAVDTSDNKSQECQERLWGPTGDRSMHCFAYGGSDDKCHLNNRNDDRDGLYKDPSECYEETFYLWDEPDTQHRDYTWAGINWLDYSKRFSAELMQMRSRGTKVTGPMLKAGDAGVLGNNMRTFMNACGGACSNPNDPAYIDIIAINAFCGSWNPTCRDGAEFIHREADSVSAEQNGLPVYVTNWSRIGTVVVAEQVEAVECIDAFFPSPSSIIKRVYWFGAKDYGGGAERGGYLTNVLSDGRTLGQLWREKCDSLNN